MYRDLSEIKEIMFVPPAPAARPSQSTRCPASRHSKFSTPPGSRSPARSRRGSAADSRRRSPSWTSAPLTSMESCPSILACPGTCRHLFSLVTASPAGFRRRFSPVRLSNLLIFRTTISPVSFQACLSLPVTLLEFCLTLRGIHCTVQSMMALGPSKGGFRWSMSRAITLAKRPGLDLGMALMEQCMSR